MTTEGFLEALDRLDRAAANLEDCCRRQRGVFRRLRRRYQRSPDLEAALLELGVTNRRHAFRNAVDELDATRHEVRVAAFEILRSEGVSIADMGRLFGVSRQLVSRTIHDAAG